jgi:uncharacterized membrane protein
MGSWKRDFASGLIILTPLLVTLFVVVWIFNQLAGLPVPVDNPAARVALTIAVFTLLVFAIGYLMRTAFGAVFESTLDSLINRLPGLRVVYNASKMAVETALGGTENLQAPVKVETWNGMRMTAFKTGQKTDDGRDLLFLPTAPNITTGFVIEVEPDQYTETEESLEDALTRVLSAGFGENHESGLSQLLDDRGRAVEEDGDTPTDGSGDGTGEVGDVPTSANDTAADASGTGPDDATAPETEQTD